MKQRILVGVVAGSIALLHLNCGSSDDCAETRTCAASSSSGDGGADGTSSGGDGSVVVPPGCDPAADPKDSPACVSNDFAIFVDATNGADGNSGTKELPVKTIGNALTKLGGRPRIYVCEGTYPESVKLTSAVSLYGGFACGAWTYNGRLPKIAPGNAGASAVEIENVSAALSIVDLYLESAPADATHKNSIALRIVDSKRVLAVRDHVSSGAGFRGADGAAGTTSALLAVSNGSKDFNGNPASGTTVADAKQCTCSTGDVTTGAAGGAAGASGGGGAPTIAGTGDDDGAGGVGGQSCGGAGTAHSGRIGSSASNASGPSTVGLFDAGRWLPADGSKGANGNVGQGGGGGGGLNASNAGGGGGCGGCPGTGGDGGAGGGASVAVALLNSAAEFVNSTLATANGGDAGKGGAGGTGSAGGDPGLGLCPGGAGGKGGDGGAGSGGAGGISVGILYKGTAPTVDATTEAAIAVGAAGAKGIGGAPGVNDGPEGVSQKILGL